MRAIDRAVGLILLFGPVCADGALDAGFDEDACNLRNPLGENTVMTGLIASQVIV